VATKTQFEIFKSVYDEENTRLSELVTRAKVYLSVETFILGALFFKFDSVLKITSGVTILPTLFILSVAFFLGALLLTIASLRILRYEGICYPEEVIRQFKEKPPQDSDFLDDRIVDLAVATQRNSRQNDKRAKCLQWAGTCLLIGFAFSTAFLLVVVTIQPISGGG
jgi:hypothetical protein